MSEFITRFLIGNLFITLFIGIVVFIKRFFRQNISGRTQFNLWFFMFGLMMIPFLSFHIPGLQEMFQFADGLTHVSETGTSAIGRLNPSISQSMTSNWASDFAISVSREIPDTLSCLFLEIWIVGMLAMLILVMHSKWRLSVLKSSSLPLQNKQVYALFYECISILNIKSEIALYSTAFLQSPITIGLLHPQIYIPIHIISDYNEKDMRFILLHELQHYRHKDMIPNLLMNIAGIFYWFNPAVWYAIKEMRTDREIACDSAVLQYLAGKDHIDYGYTLINFAEKISLSPFPFASGLSGNMKQIKKRIINIASYQPSSYKQRLRGCCCYILIAFLFLTSAPLLSTYAAEQEHYMFQTSDKNVSYVDFSSYFDGYNGCFVLYDTADDSWQIYNEEQASIRVSPDSTYKIYEGLIGLESGIISPEDSLSKWDGTNYPFTSWNADQDLNTAMHNSVNWYFEKIEASVGMSAMQDYLNHINYGNKNISAGKSFWMESSLKISPIEQVELLKAFHTNQFSMNPSNIEAIKDAICISTDSTHSFYGKTGTGRINGYDVNGWFIGYIEESDHTSYFALNIQSDTDATGNTAAKIAQTILADLNILN